MSAEPKPPRNHPAIEEAFRTAPRELVAQILSGQLHLSPRPIPDHANVAESLSEELGPPFRRGRGGPGGWILLPEPQLQLGPRPDKPVPDMAGWRRARVQPDTFTSAAISLAPDWVCEVLSPDTEVTDRAEKMPIYAREGVAHAWLIDPTLQQLEVYRLDHGALRQVASHRGSAPVRAEPFDAIELNLGLLWTW